MELHSILNSIGLGVSLLSIFWLTAVKITRLEVKVDTMWGFLVKRAVVEGVEKGWLSANSPVRLKPNSIKPFVHLSDELRKFGIGNQNLKESDLMLAVEREFGSRLIHEICIPNKLSFGVCLLVATAIARNDNHTLTDILDEFKIPKYNV